MKKWNQYKAILVDLDGTLYYQLPCRIYMAWCLLCYYVFHLNRAKDLLIIKEYRSVREKGTDDESDDIEELQYQVVADKLKVNKEQVREVITKWMLEAPLTSLVRFRDSVLMSSLTTLRQQGIKVVVYSDYPVTDKLKALEFESDAAYYSGDENINALKPSPNGILYILESMKLDKKDAIMIGDRMEKDGMAAKTAGVDFCILSTKKEKRQHQIDTYMSE